MFPSKRQFRKVLEVRWEGILILKRLNFVISCIYYDEVNLLVCCEKSSILFSLETTWQVTLLSLPSPSLLSCLSKRPSSSSWLLLLTVPYLLAYLEVSISQYHGAERVRSSRASRFHDPCLGHDSSLPSRYACVRLEDWSRLLHVLVCFLHHA